MQVSVRELKNNLSKYLQFVRMGKPVIVTSRNTPLARLVPIPKIESASLQQLLRSEEIHWNGKKPKGGRSCPRIRGKTAAERLLEDRG